MSILAEVDPGQTATATARQGILTLLLLFLTLAGLVAAWRFWRAGVFRRHAVLGPDRTAGPHVGWSILVTLLLGTSAWVGTQVAMGTYKQAQWARAGHEGSFSANDLTPGDLAFLSTVPGLVAILTVGLCLALWRDDQRPRLGVEPTRIPDGLARGAAAVVLVLPLILWVSTSTEWFYKAIHFEHPAEHEMLKAMTDGGRWVKLALIAGAVMVAPIVEELLFRGLFQTLLVWAFNNAAIRHQRPAGFAVVGPPEADVPPPPAPPSPARLATGRWLAILVTAMVFAGIHPKWSVPPIFVLALCLGFVYERTGNLWATMTIHALFNGFETAVYLSGLSGS